MPFPAIGRVGLAGAPHQGAVKRTVQERASCDLAAGELYVFPNSTTVIDATSPVTFKWNTACAVATSTVDLYLYESAGCIKTWPDVDFSTGEYTVQLQPKWWNDTTTASLQMSILDHGADLWDTSSPAGPVFTAIYAASAMVSTTTSNGQVITSTVAAAATESKDAVFHNVSSTNNGDKSSISKGAIAAAVVVPIVVIALIIAVAVRFWRMREAEKRKRWSQALSTHSNLEWEKGAMPGEKPPSALGRPSMGGRLSMGTRPSMSSYGGNPRPTSSIYAVENNMAGAGAGSGMQFRPDMHPEMSSLRSKSVDNLSAAGRGSVVMPDGQVRQSRISFAEQARPDRVSRASFGGDIRPNVSSSSIFRLPGASKSANDLVISTNRRSAAYATGSALDDEEHISVSPSQQDGPLGFAEADLRRVAQGQRTGRKSLLSLGSGRDNKRQSVASALSGDDFRSAASARGSVDELRDMENMVLHRRSMMSQASPSPNFEAAYSADAVESLQDPEPVSMPLPSPIPAGQDPDQALAMYAAQRANAMSPTNNNSPPNPSRSNSTMKIPFFSKKSASSNNSSASAPGAGANPEQGEVPTMGPPVEMRSYVHLNSGTVSADVVNALPKPGPPATTSVSGPSEVSKYSEEESK
ncbi:hypothetical protein CNBG_9314 [Cryptococcus deuterogattii R265]|uniref:Uncharacterized protein n=1 Tax=Cryptococcus deuterogattii (strain R265) TaxID=294750 RepID=A0A0L6DHX1_CRYD2|nr:hypothetical protein I309_00803 [Cryptococcus deuterogattii LA55]KIR75278.1 hypothetical protein I310_01556 [Cryptococcus deuterogattii CA1014]KIR92946.1 hypothetical protein I304_03527 [Cryptococcus deuterogattii CBS 10090]KIR98269.1 hypothetical protein L804_04731 [Cryptococcus deuterogattii 2001/935-1]KNX50002.1 hypothetical protein CNBG_9314 [Cryptococcus deuterogattii R265]